MLPTELKEQISAKTGLNITRSLNLSGGSINEAVRLIFEDGTESFLKWNKGTYEAMFATEVKGLQLLDQMSEDVIIPEIYDWGTTPDGEISWLLLAYVNQGRSDGSFFEDFGRALARLHQNTAENFGLEYDNYIGRLPQSNTWTEKWVDFFVHERLEPQLRQALKSGLLDREDEKHAQNLFVKLDELLPESPPSLLHGDLWSGNYMASTQGEPVLIDPAVYYGHREAELAFTRLFGGFSSAFYRSYEELWPLEPGFENRVAIFNLYPLLVHVNLFGRSYTSQVKSIIKKF